MCADESASNEAASGWVTNLNAGGTRGYTALMQAGHSSKWEAFKTILDRGTP
jgi:hypothetical protein